MKKIFKWLVSLFRKKRIYPLEPKDCINGEWQLCPKCNGQGIVSKPPYIAGDIDHWTSNQTQWECNVCNGKKIITRFLSQTTKATSANTVSNSETFDEWSKITQRTD